MRRLLVFLLAASIAWAAPRHSGNVHVRSTVTRQGTYRQSHVRTAPDHTRIDNYSTRGNTNPYTSKKGTKSPYKVR
jgi:hypothetical protein